MQKWKNTPQATIDEICRHLRDGASMGAACRAAGIDVVHVPPTILARIPAELRRSSRSSLKVRNAEIDELRRLIVDGGMSITDAAAHIGRSMTGVLKNLKLHAPDLQVYARRAFNKRHAAETKAAWAALRANKD